MPKVLVVATSHKTKGGITSVVKAHQQGEQWRKFHCKWIETHKDGNKLISLLYFVSGFLSFIVRLPFVEIVHIHLSEPMSLIRKMFFFIPTRVLRKKVIVHFHSFSPETTLKGKYKKLYKYVFSKANIVIALSEYWKKLIDDFCDTRVVVLYNPCPVILDTPIYQRKKHILYAGAITERKGYDDLIKAFSKIALRHPDWQIVFAGNGEIDNGIKLSENLGIAHQVIFLGWVNGIEKDKAFKESCIFCLPSYNEGFPMAVLDAFAYGLPVITTPVGGIPDIAIDGDNMLLFKPGDIGALSVNLDLLISNTDLRNKLIASSRNFASKTFNLDNINHQLGEIYEKLITKI